MTFARDGRRNAAGVVLHSSVLSAAAMNWWSREYATATHAIGNAIFVFRTRRVQSQIWIWRSPPASAKSGSLSYASA